MKNTWKGKYGPLLIAEIGGNHEGDFDYAFELANLAIKADVDYVKFQLYTGDTLVNEKESPDRNKHFKKFELSKENYLKLANLCKNNGVGFMASVWDMDFIKWINEYIDIYKIGSGDLTAFDILKKIVKLQKPIILSTGLANLSEVDESIKYIQSIDSNYCSPDFLAILQCTSMYPIKNSEANLAVMENYRNLFKLPVGYSDHTEGIKALEIAVAMGAEILEFHFTDSREGKTFRDHKVSLTLSEVNILKDKIANIIALKGSGEKAPLEVEAEHRTSFRRGLYLTRNVKGGTIISETDIISLRPNHGIDARNYEQLIGKRAKIAISKYQKLDWDFFSS